MAFAAVISLKNTIERLKDSSRISIAPPSRGILESAYEVVKSMQELLRRLDNNHHRRESARTNALEGEMRESACKLQDVLESHVSAQADPKILSVDLEKIKHDIHSFIRTMKDTQEKFVTEFDNPSPEQVEEEEEDDDIGDDPKMIGLSDQFHEIRDNLLSQSSELVFLGGMPGVGKTILAKRVFQDPLILEKFDTRIFIKVGLKSSLKKVLSAILPEAIPDRDKADLIEEIEGLDEKMLFEHVINLSLEGRKFLLVLDDVWDVDLMNYVSLMFSEDGSESRILVTTRMQHVATFNGFGTYDIRLLNEDESWNLFCDRVFGETLCPTQHEKACKKIVENCEGLPLLIIAVADLIQPEWNNYAAEDWNKIATDRGSSVFIDAHDRISKVLYPSYSVLPQNLRTCFLYMAAFPRKCHVSRSKLINLWSAEEFLEPYKIKHIFSTLKDDLDELFSRYLVIGSRWSCYRRRYNAAVLHTTFWHLCRKEATNNKFLYVIDSFTDDLEEDIQGQRRMSVYNNILLSIKYVYDSIASVSGAHSLLCAGAYHQYQVPLCSDLRLLRVLDALTIRFYEFPLEVLKLVQLRYLAVTCNGNLPSSISKLWRLQYLIVNQHHNTRTSLAESYLPAEIWDLQELLHLQITGRNLPDPPSGTNLPNLSTLLDIDSHSCTKNVLESIPRLYKLRVQLELDPDADYDAAELSFDRIFTMCSPRNLQCVVVNPELKVHFVAPPLVHRDYLLNMAKLTLSGFGYPWKDMSTIALFPVLQVLKLKRYAFRGETWEVKENGFPWLEYLLIEDTNLVRWTAEGKAFPKLRNLTIKNCYRLKEIPETRAYGNVHLVDCNPSVVAYAKQIGYDVRADSSWAAGNLKS